MNSIKILTLYITVLLLCPTNLVKAANYQEQRLLEGIVRLDVERIGGFQDVGTGIVIGVEGDRAYLLTALHVLVGDTGEREASGWERQIEQIKIAVLFYGDPVSYVGDMLGRWNERYDLAIISVDDPRIARHNVSVVYGIGSPTTLSPPYPAVALGHGGRGDWKITHTKVLAVKGSHIRMQRRGIEGGNSGGPLIDANRMLFIGMVTAVSLDGAVAVSADFISSELQSWGVSHHLRKTQVSTPMVRIPAGYVQLGADKNTGISRRIYLDAFFIDKYETTVAEFRRFVRETGYYYRAGLGNCNYNKPDKDAYPMNCVTWEDTNSYASWAGKTLPTEAQWVKAAQGSKSNRYPWGNTPARQGDAALRIDWPVEVGSYRRDHSIYGVVDMLGNVSEWVMDWYHPSYLQLLEDTNPKGPPSGRDRVLRGASYATPVQKATLAMRKRNLPDAGRMRFDYGFRCVLNEAK